MGWVGLGREAEKLDREMEGRGKETGHREGKNSPKDAADPTRGEKRVPRGRVQCRGGSPFCMHDHPSPSPLFSVLYLFLI